MAFSCIYIEVVELVCIKQLHLVDIYIELG